MPARSFWFALLLTPLLPPAPARACNVPVFRYALERWKASPYDALVFHPGKPSAEARRLTDRLRQANVAVTHIDLSATVEAEFKRVWDRQISKKAAPCLVLRYPEADEGDPDAWAGHLTADAVTALLDSPARRELVKRLARGESAVWLLLEGGDAKADAAARDLLDAQLRRLRRADLLPEQPPEPEDLLLDLPLKVVFSSLPVSRSDPAERAFVRTLLHSDEGLDKARGPIVFAVFGRGRLLPGLHGKQLTPARLEAEARFLCGPCSCRVKELNEGVDLLLAADWDELLEAGPSSPEPPPAPKPAIPPGVPAEAPSAPNTAEAPAPWGWLAASGAAVLALAAGAWLVVARRTRSARQL